MKVEGERDDLACASFLRMKINNLLSSTVTLWKLSLLWFNRHRNLLCRSLSDHTPTKDCMDILNIPARTKQHFLCYVCMKFGVSRFGPSCWEKVRSGNVANVKRSSAARVVCKHYSVSRMESSWALHWLGWAGD